MRSNNWTDPTTDPLTGNEQTIRKSDGMIVQMTKANTFLAFDNKKQPLYEIPLDAMGMLCLTTLLKDLGRTVIPSSSTNDHLH